TLVLAADTLSIATMEVVDNAVMWLVPGAMEAGLGDWLFWVSMGLALTVAFFAALPVNRYLLRRGRGHAITHEATGHAAMDNRPLVFGIVGFLLGGLAAAMGSVLS
ncbi:membrane protein, partial [Xanthomonas oryzae pv. oryzae]